LKYCNVRPPVRKELVNLSFHRRIAGRYRFLRESSRMPSLRFLTPFINRPLSRLRCISHVVPADNRFTIQMALCFEVKHYTNTSREERSVPWSATPHIHAPAGPPANSPGVRVATANQKRRYMPMNKGPFRNYGILGCTVPLHLSVPGFSSPQTSNIRDTRHSSNPFCSCIAMAHNLSSTLVVKHLNAFPQAQPVISRHVLDTRYRPPAYDRRRVVIGSSPSVQIKADKHGLIRVRNVSATCPARIVRVLQNTVGEQARIFTKGSLLASAGSVCNTPSYPSQLVFRPCIAPMYPRGGYSGSHSSREAGFTVDTFYPQPSDNLHITRQGIARNKEEDLSKATLPPSLQHVRTDLEKAVKQHLDIGRISDEVYRNIERRIKTERERRGM